MSIHGASRLVLLLAAGLTLAAPSLGAIHHPGKWTNPILWSDPASSGGILDETAVNLALLALPDSAGQTQARIVWFQDTHGHPDNIVYGGYWDWRPPNEQATSQGAFPDTSAASGTLRARRFPTPGWRIFCAGANYAEEDTTLAGEGMGYGRLLVFAGTTEGENGSRRAGTYNARVNAWDTTANRLAVGRWYPTLTTLPASTLVLSGSQYRESWSFGGVPADSHLYRLPIASDQSWLAPLVPAPFTGGGSPEYLGSRRGHTASTSMGATQVYFGGLDPGPDTLVSDKNYFWMLRPEVNPGGSDFTFAWEKRTPQNTSDSPDPRAYHTALVLGGGDSPLGEETLVVVGGQTAAGVDSSLWFGTLVSSDKVAWREFTPAAGSDPFPARFGHAAFWHGGVRRMFVYGGTGSLAGAPGDPEVYAFQFFPGSTQVLIKRCTVNGEGEINGPVVPNPRRDFASALLERHILKHPPASDSLIDVRGLMVYGGRTSSGSVSDSLYAMWVLGPTTVRWQRIAQAGARPPALEHAAGIDGSNIGAFYVSGGRDSNGVAQDAVYSTDYDCHPCTGTSAAMWATRDPLGQPAWGHTAGRAVHETFARTPELYSPTTHSFTHFASANRVLDWYPHVFVVPGSGAGKVVTTSPGDSTWIFDPAAGSWTNVAGATTPGFRGGSAVLYRPGKVMKCGSRDTDTGEDDAIGTTKTLDISNLASGGNPAWQASADMSTGRVNHNLVILPDGRVLAAGGMGTCQNDVNIAPRRRPELWDPLASGGAGAWEGGYGSATPLDSSLVARGYHSTALLLPDGRVICSGGNGTDGIGAAWHRDQFRTDLYSPPYLFNANGTLATRPALLTAPRRVAYGQEFAITVGAASTDSVASACLIRAGATTHGYDPAQLYLPLTFTAAGGSGPARRYYRATAPGDPTVAPPGEYLLFVLNAGGTPSLARWVKLGGAGAAVAAPTTIADLGRECVDGTAVRLHWTPPACLNLVGGSVVAAAASPQYQVRYSTAPMHDLADFAAATAVAGTPGPGTPYGNLDRVDTPALAAGQTYYFRLRAKNAAGQWSELSHMFTWTVQDQECGGSGGGGGGGGYEEGARIRPGATLHAAYGRPGGASPPDTAFLENTLLANVPPGVTRTDRLRLPFGPRWTGAGARVRLSRGGTRATHFEHVRLLAADHAADEAVFVRGGELLAGITHDPLRVVHADGRELTDVFLAGGAFEGRAGDTLYVELGGPGAGSFALASSGAQFVQAQERAGIELAGEDGTGWVPIGHHEVRERTSDEVFDTPSLARVRLVFHGAHRLDGIARFTPGEPPAVTAFEPAAAAHSRLGDVAAALAGEGTTLAAGEHLLADFAAVPAPEGTLREWYLEVTGAHVEGGGGAAQAAALAGEGEALPTVFAFARSRPNPFSRQATLGFDVPVRTHVRLEVFDVAGRRVATLANREYAPGRFSVAWDGRTSAGTSARAGVYLCRMSAGAFHREQHLVLVR